MKNSPHFSQCNIVVIGDVMLDRYWHGDTFRISPEAPVPVVHIDLQEERVGGAANVAVNAQALGVQTTLVGVIGEDEPGNTLTRLLNEKNIKCLFEKSHTPTTLKLRVLGRNQQLIRLDFESKNPWQAQLFLDAFSESIAKADVLILSDYAKGVIAQPQVLIQYARAQGLKVIVDPKNRDLSVYRNATLLTPNLLEFEAYVGHCETEEELGTKGQQLVNELNLEALLITRGSQGMTIVPKNGDIVHLPSQTKEVYDVTGAGDTVIAVLSACIGVGMDLLQAVEYANLAAGISVGKLGTATVTWDEMQIALGKTEDHLLVTESGLMPIVTQLKAAGKKVIMTNGCFDILHAGHVSYLKKARAMGDCLIIAVNDDASVRRLKGSERPINNIMARMQVLAALQCVDYVVPFTEDTPERLIANILPDVLVKAADYTPDQIAGGKQVIANGGDVRIIPFVEGCSTTSMIEKMVQTRSEKPTEEIA